MIEIIGPKDTDFDFNGKQRFNVTSHSTTITKQLSPFFLGPCKLYGNYHSKTVENAWQYAKVYKQYAKDGNPTLNGLLRAGRVHTPSDTQWARKPVLCIPGGMGRS